MVGRAMNIPEKIKEQIEEIKKEPGRIFGLVYILIFGIGVSIGLYYISNLNNISRNTVTPALTDTTEVQDLKVVEARSIPSVDVMEISKPSDELLNTGEQLYNQICASCHGQEGKGDGPAGNALNPPPRNFVNPERWVNGPKITDLYKTLEEGIPNTAMIAYDYLLPQEKFALSHYMQNTFMVSPPQATKEELQELEMTYNLSQAKEIPAQIPVEAAMEIIVNENKQLIDEIVSVQKQIAADTSETGAVIFNQIADNRIQALYTLKISQDWKKDSGKFQDIVKNNNNITGFFSNTDNLTDDEWNKLYNYMIRYF